MKKYRLQTALAILAFLLATLLVVYDAFAYPDYTVVTSDGYDNQAGDIILTPDGDLLVPYRKGVSDGSDKGKIVSKRSSNLGKTWQPEVLIYEDPVYDVQVPMMTVLKSGEILITFWLFDYQAGIGIPDGVIVGHSTNDGHIFTDFNMEIIAIIILVLFLISIIVICLKTHKEYKDFRDGKKIKIKMLCGHYANTWDNELCEPYCNRHQRKK